MALPASQGFEGLNEMQVQSLKLVIGSPSNNFCFNIHTPSFMSCSWKVVGKSNFTGCFSALLDLLFRILRIICFKSPKNPSFLIFLVHLNVCIQQWVFMMFTTFTTFVSLMSGTPNWIAALSWFAWATPTYHISDQENKSWLDQMVF